MALIFYDTETTGVETFFDQILQFAAIRTDENLNILERFEVRSRLLPHVVPAPEAMRINGVRVAQLTDSGMPSHYEMARAIFTKLESWCPGLFVGWNSIDFDENMIRQALYKTLHNPYLTSRVGNSRSDIMRIVQACSLFAPDALNFPRNEEGNIVFKLSEIAPANRFDHRAAHDAMGDVEATIHICRLICDKAPNVWSAFMRFSKKAAVVDYIAEERVFCVTDFYFGRPYSHLVSTIGQNQENKAEWYVYDLSVDPAELECLNDAQLTARLAEYPKPVRRLKSNAAPMLFPADEAPESCRGRNLGDELAVRADRLQQNEGLRKKLVAAFESRREKFPKSPHVEKQIYDAFFEKSDEALMNTFHQSPWEKRLEIVGRFRDARLRTIGSHLIYLERPELLDNGTRKQHDSAMASRLLGRCDDVSWLTLPNAMGQIRQMIAASTDLNLAHLQEHEAFLQQRHDSAIRIVA